MRKKEHKQYIDGVIVRWWEIRNNPNNADWVHAAVVVDALQEVRTQLFGERLPLVGGPQTALAKMELQLALGNIDAKDGIEMFATCKQLAKTLDPVEDAEEYQAVIKMARRVGRDVLGLVP